MIVYILKPHLITKELTKIFGKNINQLNLKNFEKYCTKG